MRFLLLMTFANDNLTDRIKTDIAPVLGIIARHTGGCHEVAYRSKDGYTFGFYLKADNPTGMHREITTSTFFHNSDSAVLIEVGGLVAGLGASRSWTWLQRND